MISSRLEQLLDENRNKQVLVFDDFIADMKNRWDDSKYYFDEEEARKIYKFISLLRNDKGTSRRFTILRFQFEIIAEILCVKDKKKIFGDSERLILT